MSTPIINIAPCVVRSSFSSEIELDIVLDVSWKDERLNITGNCNGFIDNSTLTRIWTPRTDIYHKSAIKIVDRIGATTDFYSADPDYIYWYLQLVLAVQCPFDFSFYPFDAQWCNVIFASHFHTDQVVQYSTWALNDDSKEIQQALKYGIQYEELPNDSYYNYSTSGFKVKLSRHLTYALTNTFIPSFITVMIAFCRSGIY